MKLINDAGGVRFKCPSCQQTIVERTVNERKIVTKYTCEACGFVGPN